jgi:fumarate reductase subunit D
MARRGGGDIVNAMSSWRHRDHPAYWAFVVHRVSGLLLALFLPLHFLALGTALSGPAALDGFLAWTANPLVKISEIALVFLLAAHLTGGLRLLLIEFSGWRTDAQKTMLAAVGGIAAFCALAFALNLL